MLQAPVRMFSVFCLVLVSAVLFEAIPSPAHSQDGWSTIFGPPPAGLGVNGGIRALTVYNNELVAAGSFTQAGGVAAHYIARFDGTQWHPLGSGTNDVVLALVVFNGSLIAGGHFTSAGGIGANRVARWDGTTWSNLGAGFGDDVLALTVSNGWLFAGGDFNGNVGLVAQWFGDAWEILDPRLIGGRVSGLTDYSGSLVAAGNFDQDNTGVELYHVATWDGEWYPMPPGDPGFNGIAYAAKSHGAYAVVGGAFSMAGGRPASRIARWDGYDWWPMGSGMNDIVTALGVHGSDLIAGGSFTTAGGVSANRVARWTGTWSALGTGLDNTVNAVASYNGNLFVGGAFVTAGGQPSYHIARWGPLTLGACCYPDGHCEALESQQCATGDWRPGISCTPNPCPSPQACCFAQGVCQVLSAEECLQAGGLPQGSGSACAPNPCPMTLVHMSDVHVGGGILHPDADQRWPVAIRRITDTLSPTPSAVLITGDNVQWGGGEVGQENYTELLVSLYSGESYWEHYADAARTMPVYFSPGNHDWAPELLRTLDNYHNYITPNDYYSVLINDGILVCVLDGGHDEYGNHCDDPSLPPGVALRCRAANPFHPEGSGITTAALDALEADLARFDDRICKVICLHHPYINPGSPFGLLDGVFLHNRTRFYDICTSGSGVDAILCGHIHGQASTMDGCWDLSGGTWTPEDGPRVIAAPSLAEENLAKIIQIEGGSISGYEDVSFGSTLSGSISCNTDIVIEDAQGRTMRALDSLRTEVQIPGGWYMITVADSAGHRKTLHQFGVAKADTSTYALSIRTIASGPTDVDLTTTLTDGHRTDATYLGLPLLEASVADVRTDEAMWNYEMTVVDSDSTVWTATPDTCTGNAPPRTPSAPLGPAETGIGEEESYEATTFDAEGDSLWYQFSWGDGELSPWIGPIPAGGSGVGSHSWPEADSFAVNVRARDPGDQLSGWSEPLWVNVLDPNSAVPDSPATTGVSIRFANPYRLGDPIALRTSANRSPVEISIHDVSGRQIRGLYRGLLDAPGTQLHWDGSSDSGRKVGAGVYFIWMRLGTNRMHRSLVVIK